MFCVLLNLCLFERMLVNKDVPRPAPLAFTLFKLLRCLLREGA